MVRLPGPPVSARRRAEGRHECGVLSAYQGQIISADAEAALARKTAAVRAVAVAVVMMRRIVLSP